MLPADSPTRELLGPHGVALLEHAASAIERILPHAETDEWRELPWQEPRSAWSTPRKGAIELSFAVGPSDDALSRSLHTLVTRRRVAGAPGPRPLDQRERDICRQIAVRASELLTRPATLERPAVLRAVREDFDEQVVADHLREHHGLELDMAQLLSALHELASQTYENRSLTFGAILDPRARQSTGAAMLAERLLRSKRYKALSDGRRTAYHISTEGQVLDFVDLASFMRSLRITQKQHFPSWTRQLARCSRDGRCGVVLTREGDILIFDEGSLRFTYRYGGWQYWNHANLVALLKDAARGAGVKPQRVGKVAAAIYRAALDMSFRRSGGLFVVVPEGAPLQKILNPADVIDDLARTPAEAEFDRVVRDRLLHALPRNVAVELASLDGALVLESSGRVLAYAAVLQPRRRGRFPGVEGSRTITAIGASQLGLAVKISSDGGITLYHKGEELLAV